MRASTTSVVVILVIGLVFGLALSSLPGATTARAAAAAVPAAANGAPAQAVPVLYSQAPVNNEAVAAAASGQSPVLVSCNAGQQTLVRQVWLNGQPVSQVECVQSNAASGVVYPSARLRTVSDERVIDDGGAAMSQPRVVRSEAPVYRQAPRVSAQPRRSWQKTALVIGGTTAAGAGLGGVIGGKKGALVGAAIGGGGSTLFEAIKRR